MKKKKILILENSTEFTGAIKSISENVNTLSYKYQFYLATPNVKLAQPLFPEVLIFNINYLEVRKNYSLLFYLPVLLINALRIIKFCSKHKVDIIHVNDIYNLIGVLVKIVKPKIKIIYHVRLLPSSYGFALYRFWIWSIIKFADKILCVSNAVYTQLPDSKKKVVIHNSICTNMNYPLKKIEVTGTLKILYLANFVNGKGHDMAIEVLGEIIKKDKNIQLIFAGHTFNRKKNNYYKERLKKLVKAHRLEDHVLFKEFVSDIELEIKNSDLVLNLSKSESFSRVCLESMFYGTPIFSLNSGGPADIIIPDITGVLFESNSTIFNISKKMIDTMREKEFMEMISNNGHKHAIEKFSIESTAHKLDAIYS